MAMLDFRAWAHTLMTGRVCNVAKRFCSRGNELDKHDVRMGLRLLLTVPTAHHVTVDWIQMHMLCMQLKCRILAHVQGYESPETIFRMFSLSQHDFYNLNPGTGMCLCQLVWHQHIAEMCCLFSHGL